MEPDVNDSSCPACGEAVAADAAFCEACGAHVLSNNRPKGRRSDTVGQAADGQDTGRQQGGGVESAGEVAAGQESPISTPTVIGAPASAIPLPPVPCAECGGAVGTDGYCERCGLKAPRARDHFREQPAPWVAGVCDRGLVHARNEDAMALWAGGARAVLVVCDGVSSSLDSDVAALAAARTARDVLRAPWPQGAGTAESADAAAVKVLEAAAAAANAAVVAGTAPSSPSPASCTFVAAVIEGALLRYAVIGDSRAYWLPDAGEAIQLTQDDSMATLLMAAGIPRAQAEAAPQAHAITKWLGRDSTDIVPVCGVRTLDGPGWVLVCSDGLWNYASEAATLRAFIDQAGVLEPLGVALALLDVAKTAGGHDNITVSLARIA